MNATASYFVSPMVDENTEIARGLQRRDPDLLEVIKPTELGFQKGASERDKRLMGRLRGVRFCYTGETISGALDWTLLKTLTGGDKLSGARLYQNETGFTPSHTMVLLTNDRPKLPPTSAFQGRLVYVPFRVSFQGREDLQLEAKLRVEAPGILWKLIQAAPPVIARGLQPPLSVQEAGADLLAENDTAAPFIEQCLVEDADAVLPLADLKDAVVKWRGSGLVLSDGDVDRVVQGVRARWPYSRKRVATGNLRGLIGVRLRPSS